MSNFDRQEKVKRNFHALKKAKMELSLIVLTVSKVQTEKDHLSPMKEWHVTNNKRKQKIHRGPRTTLYMCMNGKPGTLLQLKWAFALTNLVWICDIFLHNISDLHLKSAKKIANYITKSTSIWVVHLFASLYQAISYIFYITKTKGWKVFR